VWAAECLASGVNKHRRTIDSETQGNASADSARRADDKSEFVVNPATIDSKAGALRAGWNIHGREIYIRSGLLKRFWVTKKSMRRL
jgi:hypothetical protein